MDFDVTREQWIERFAKHLSQRRVGALPDQFLEIAAQRYETRGQIGPETAADEESARQPSAGAAGGDSQDTVDLGAQARFERTERIPVERIETAGEYVRDDGEWIARCVARVLALDPIIRAEEAQRSVSELAALERWRLMKPEAAAEQLYTPIRPR
jgi:hypothetical protein